MVTCAVLVGSLDLLPFFCTGRAWSTVAILSRLFDGCNNV